MLIKVPRQRFIILALALASACRPINADDPTPTQIPKPTATQISKASATSTIAPSPTASPSPTANAPEPAISPEGPYLAYIREGSSNYQLVLSNLYDPGREVFQLPAEAADQIMYDLWMFKNPTTRLSPDGLYFAYEAGASDSPYDLTLKVIQLANGDIVASIPVLSEDMDARISDLAEVAAADLAKELEGEPEEFWPDELLGSLQSGIRTFEWSPIQPFLAFAAQIDGPSSDLYVLDSRVGSFTRLTSGPQNIQRIVWSPNGEWIAHGAAYYIGMQGIVHNYIVSKDGWELLSLPERGMQSEGWVTSNWYLVNEAANGPGKFDLKAVHIPDPEYVTLWENPFTSWALDLGNDLLAVSMHDPFWSGAQPSIPGTYVVDVHSGSYTRVSDPFNHLETWGRGSDRFLASANDGVYVVSAKNEVRQIHEVRANISVSPDREKIVFYHSSDDNPSVAYFPASDLEVPFFTEEITCVLWLPDSSSFFFMSNSDLHRYNVVTSDDQIVDENIVGKGSTCPIRIVAN